MGGGEPRTIERARVRARLVDQGERARPPGEGRRHDPMPPSSPGETSAGQSMLSERRQYQSEVRRRRDLGQRRDIRNGYSGRHTTLGWRIKERIRESRSPGRAGGGTLRREAE